MGRALAAVGTALALCFAAIGTLVYVTREEDMVAVDAILSESITRAVNDASRFGEPMALTDETPFEWDRVLVFDARTPRAEVSEALGFPWKGELLYTAQSTDFFVFVHDGKLARFADYRGVGRFEGIDRPFAWLTPEEAVFDVRDGVARPAQR